jgi:hypothetical protein
VISSFEKVLLWQFTLFALSLHLFILSIFGFFQFVGRLAARLRATSWQDSEAKRTHASMRPPERYQNNPKDSEREDSSTLLFGS